MISKLLLPETGIPSTLGQVRTGDDRRDTNVLDAAARGTRDGLHLALNIAAMLIAFLGLVALLNLGLAQFGTSLQGIFGWLLAPVAYLLGVPWEDCKAVGGLLGTRTALNELIAFEQLGKLHAQLLDRSFVIASFALCGFANLSSIGIQLGGIGALAPERRADLARLGFRALGRHAGQLSFRLHRGSAVMTPAVHASADLVSRAAEATAVIRAEIGEPPAVALILGSGMGGLAKDIEDRRVIPYAQIPHFPTPTVPGHEGNIVCGTLDGARLIVLQGRSHYYEGHSLETVTFPVRRAPVPECPHAGLDGGRWWDSFGLASRQRGRSVGSSQPDWCQPASRLTRRPPGPKIFGHDRSLLEAAARSCI